MSARMSLLCCAIGSAICLIGLSCEEEKGILVEPSPQFVSLRIYDLDPWRDRVEGEQELAQIAHVDIGRARTEQIFQHIRHKSRRPLATKGPSYSAVARCEDGKEHNLELVFRPLCFVGENEGECYYLEGASAGEMDDLLRIARERVFIPAHERRTSTSQLAELVPIESGGRYGYADHTGSVVIQARFDDAGLFSEGLAAVRIGDAEHGKWGYIDVEGHLVIKPQFAGASFFSNGLAVATVNDFFTGNQGYIDRSGQWAIGPQFQKASPFRRGAGDGLTARVVKDGHKYSIDTRGDEISSKHTGANGP